MKAKELTQILFDNGIKNNNYYLQQISNKRIYSIAYKDIAKNNSNSKKYQEISDAKGKLGVYFFYKEVNGKVEWLYVGESHILSKTRDLSERIKQHFRPNDNGGLPFKISQRESLNGKEVIKRFIDESVKLMYFILEDSMIKQEILLLESFLIAILRPKYNFISERTK